MKTHNAKMINSSNTHQKSKVALKAFFGICDQWNLNAEQARVLLGNPAPRTFARWKKLDDNLILNQDKFERISYILGIYKALRILLPNAEAANQWIHKPNTATLFAGCRALDKLLQGRVIDLADVRRYLDAERGG